MAPRSVSSLVSRYGRKGLIYTWNSTLCHFIFDPEVSCAVFPSFYSWSPPPFSLSLDHLLTKPLRIHRECGCPPWTTTSGNFSQQHTDLFQTLFSSNLGSVGSAQPHQHLRANCGCEKNWTAPHVSQQYSTSRCGQVENTSNSHCKHNLFQSEGEGRRDKGLHGFPQVRRHRGVGPGWCCSRGPGSVSLFMYTPETPL